MRRRLAVLLVLVTAACKKEPTWEPDLSTPDAAMRCEVVSIRTEDLAALRSCMHPAVRDVFDREAAPRAKAPGFWNEMKDRAKPLEQAIPSKLVEGPVPAEKSDYGDRAASYRLGHDSFEAIRAKDGKWYVVDTGI